MEGNLGKEEEVVKADEYLECLPAKIVESIGRALSKDGGWHKLAQAIHSDEVELSKSSSPEKQLLHQLINKYFVKVGNLQALLNQCQLYHVLRIINTNEPAKFVSPEKDSEFPVQLCSSVSLPVEVCGSPFPDLQWYLNDEPIIGETSPVLQLQKFRVKDGGEYTCKLRQRLGGSIREATSHKYILNIMKAPPRVTVDVKDLHIKANDDLTVCCEVIGYPEPKCFQWFKDDNQLIAQTEFPQLKIQSADVHNAGKYYCVASNTVGYCRTRIATVKVDRPVIYPDKPEIIEQPSANPVYFVGDWMCFVCKVACAVDVKFTCFLNNRELIGSRNSLITTSSSNHLHQCEVRYHLTQQQMERENWKQLQFKFGVKTAYCEVLSDDVTVQVKTRCVKKIFTARNKWALVIGNSHYLQMTQLPATGGDIHVMMKIFVKLEFRVFMMSDLKRTAMQNAVRLFANFIQKGDYVCIYYAGHGIHSDGTDYIIPVDARVTYVERRSMNVSVREKDTSLGECTSCVWITNVLQKYEPALIFMVYDACRTLKQKAEGYQSHSSPDHYQTAASNFFSIFATSESYSAYENDDTANSFLVTTLQDLMTYKISIQELSFAVLQKFSFPDNEEDIQVPKICGDLSLPLSLSDPSQPHDIDKHESGVLQRWETLASGGGRIQDIVVMGSTQVECSLHWNVAPRHNGVTWYISNSMDFIVNLTQHNVKDGLREMDVVIKLTTGLKDFKAKLRESLSLMFPVPHLQDLKDCLDVELHFIYEGKLFTKVMRLLSPAITRMFYKENYIE